MSFINKKAAILALIVMCVSVEASNENGGPDSSGGAGSSSSLQSNGQGHLPPAPTQNGQHYVPVEQLPLRTRFLGAPSVKLQEDLTMAWKAKKLIDNKIEKLKNEIKAIGPIEQLEEKLAATKEYPVRNGQWNKMFIHLPVPLSADSAPIVLRTARIEIDRVSDELSNQVDSYKRSIQAQGISESEMERLQVLLEETEKQEVEFDSFAKRITDDYIKYGSWEINVEDIIDIEDILEYVKTEEIILLKLGNLMSALKEDNKKALENAAAVKAQTLTPLAISQERVAIKPFATSKVYYSNDNEPLINPKTNKPVAKKAASIFANNNEAFVTSLYGAGKEAQEQKTNDLKLVQEENIDENKQNS